MALKYKLTQVVMEEGPPQDERQVCVIGYFSNEPSLENWARENEGELDKRRGES